MIITMKIFIAEIFLILNVCIFHSDARFHHHDPIKKHSSHTRTNKTLLKSPSIELCSGNSKQDTTLIKQFYVKTFNLFKKEKPGCVCIQLCQGKPAYCYPDGCFHSLGGCPHNAKPTTNTSEKSFIHNSNSDSETTNSKNLLATQGDFLKKEHTRINKEGRDQMKKRENDSFPVEDGDLNKSPEISEILTKNYTYNLNISKLIDKDYTQWPKSKLYQNMPLTNFSQWNFDDLSMDEMSTISQLYISPTTSLPYLMENKGKIPSFYDFKQQFESLPYSQQMPNFYDFFIETKEIMGNNRSVSTSTVGAFNHTNGYENNGYYQNIDFSTINDVAKRIVSNKLEDIPNERHDENLMPNKQDITDEKFEEGDHAVEAFSEIYNNFVKRFDDNQPLAATLESMVNNYDFSRLTTDTLNTQYFQKAATEQYVQHKQVIDYANHKTLDETTKIGISAIARQESTPKYSKNLSDEEFNVIFNNFYGTNQSNAESEVTNTLGKSIYLTTVSPLTFQATSGIININNVSNNEQNNISIDTVMSSASKFRIDSGRAEPTTKKNYSFRVTLLKPATSNKETYKNMSAMAINHKTTTTVPQVRFSNDFAQLKNRDMRPTSQIFSSVNKHTRLNKYVQKDRKMHIQPKRQSHGSAKYPSNIKSSEVGIVTKKYPTQNSRNEAQVNAKTIPHNESKYSRRKRPTFAKN